MAQPAQSASFDDGAVVLGSNYTLASPSAACSQPLSPTFVEDSNWEPDGVTHHVRFCEGPGVTVGWLRSCGTAGKPGGNREDKHQPVPPGEPGLLTKVGHDFPGETFRVLKEKEEKQYGDSAEQLCKRKSNRMILGAF